TAGYISLRSASPPRGESSFHPPRIRPIVAAAFPWLSLPRPDAASHPRREDEGAGVQPGTSERAPRPCRPHLEEDRRRRRPYYASARRAQAPGEKSRARLFRRARYLDHPEVAADHVWWRGRPLHRRSRPRRGT